MTTDQELLQALSALADGRATPEEWQRIEAAWAQDPTLQARWLAWHQAGDGLRSPELLAPAAQPPEQLLARLHAQPAAAVAPAAPGRGWLPPLAVAASFVALALLLGPLQTPAPSGGPQAAAMADVTVAPAALSFAQRVTTPPTPDFGLAGVAHGTVVDGALRTPAPLWPEPGASAVSP